MPDEARDSIEDSPSAQRAGGGEDRVLAALAHLRRSLPGDGSASGPGSFASQEACLTEWATGLGLLLNPHDLPAKAVKGGQEHDLWHEEATDRYWKLTKNRVFGLNPGIELALVSSAEDARRFHLWEATPLQYLERLDLHNLLVPGLNRLEGIIAQPGDLSIVTSQPRFDIVAVTQQEIDDWFASLGFQKVTTAAYYRADDNLGVFDAHDKNVIRAGDTLMPCDVIPCQPDGGFLDFIRDTLAGGHSLRAVRTTHTSPPTE
jgi:hypothetical protein